MPITVCRITRKGRFVVGEPHFEPGPPITLAGGKAFIGDVGQLAAVAVTRTVGRVVEVLGSEDDVRAVLRGVLAEAGHLGEVPPPGQQLGSASREVATQLAQLPREIPLIDQREDLRGQLCVTIDPPDARDHDDAIAIEAVDGVVGLDGHGAVVIWVHIADVSAYVPTGSPIDLVALDRGNSTYVPGMVAPMLPHELSSDLCSLLPGLDRGCVSVRIELADDGSVRGVRFARTLIRSARRLTYDQVDELLEHGRSIDPMIDELLRALDHVTARLRAMRMRRGALDLMMDEVRFELDERTVRGATLEPESASHRLVEECMLLANEAVGSRLARSEVEGLWRIHAHPEPASIIALVAQLDELGVPTPPLPDHMTGRDAARMAGEIVRVARRYSTSSGRGRAAFAPRILRALQQATYEAHAGVHSGLATADYAHFTSPIRRYADLVNHRSLLRLIGASDEPPVPVGVDAVALHVSSTERASVVTERRADAIARAHLLYNQLFGASAHLEGAPGNAWSGEVTGLIAAGAFVRFADVHEGFLPARTIDPEQRYMLDDAGVALVGSRSGHRLRLGDCIDVYVAGVDRAAGKVELRRVGTEAGTVRAGHPRGAATPRRGGSAGGGNGRYRRPGGGRRGGRR